MWVFLGRYLKVKESGVEEEKRKSCRLLTSATRTLCCIFFLDFIIRTMAASISCFLSSSTFCRVSFLSGSDSPCLAATKKERQKQGIYLKKKSPSSRMEHQIKNYIVSQTVWGDTRCPPVCILTLCSLEVNWSLTVKTWPLSISFDFGSLVSTLCVGFPQAKDCNARTNSLSGISVSCWISCGNRRAGSVGKGGASHRVNKQALIRQWD